MKNITPIHSRRHQASRPSYFKAAVLTLVMQIPLLTFAGGAETEVPWESFTATSLTYEKVDSSVLLGQPTLHIITPSKAAADSTKAWTNALEKALEGKKLEVNPPEGWNEPAEALAKTGVGANPTEDRGAEIGTLTLCRRAPPSL